MSRRDFAEALRGVRCWDRGVQEVFEARGEPVVDCVLQNRDELIGLCEVIAQHRIRSFVEVGIWTGRLASTLHQIFDFDLVGVCDHRWAEQLGLPITVPDDARTCWADSDSAAYRRWREELGPVDLVFIDANHSYRAVCRDFEINRGLPHRFLAFHDITGAHRATRGVGRFWRELSHGHKREIVRPHRALGLDHSIMGIGLWSASEVP